MPYECINSPNIRYHCPCFEIFNFRKPKCLSFKRRIWKYDDGNYEMLREKSSAINWNDFQNNYINTYCKINRTSTVYY